MRKISENWLKVVEPQDTVIIPGDFSWGMRLSDTKPDFAFLEDLPGEKIILKGNHDFWWETVSKLNAFIQENDFTSFHFLHNNAYICDSFIIAGSRGWYTDEKKAQTRNETDAVKIINREVGRLRASLQNATELKTDGEQNGIAREILACLHYPPCFKDYVCKELIDVLCEFGVRRCYYGHIHGSYDVPASFSYRGITFELVSADFLNFCPLRILPLS